MPRLSARSHAPRCVIGDAIGGIEIDLKGQPGRTILQDSRMDVSVVIATYNRQDLLRRLLEQLDAQTIEPSRYEVIAVDDGSKEDTREKLKDLKTRYALRIERQENSGAAVARQRGVDLAQGR